MKRTVVLVILDGWGIGKKDESNPIHVANLENLRYIEEHFPGGALQASGISVGLPWEEVGNSEVGHLTLGAGKVLYQHLPKISISIEEGTFFKNPKLLEIAAHVKKNNSALHLAGLLTSGSVHASLKHVIGLLEFAKKENIKNVFLHLWTDGKDGPPRNSEELIKKLEKEISRIGTGKIASVSGRYYAMDRDAHFDRTEKAYRAMTSVEPKGNFESAIKDTHDKDLNDEFVEPTITSGGAPISKGDALIFWNFREDSVRQISRAFLDSKFTSFKRDFIPDLYVATMTEYEEENGAQVLFERDVVKNPLGKVIANSGKTQLRIAETEKYAHVTYFFNGLEEKPFPNEFRVLIPSRPELKPDAHPEMMASSITDRILLSLADGGFDFILANYANGDLIAHTGNFEATVKAVKIVDQEVGKLMRQALDRDHILVITSDHGNAESLLNLQTGEAETKHDPNPVPFYLIGREFEDRSPLAQAGTLKPIGLLADVAPTILELINLKKPEEMTGQSLIDQLI